MSELGLTPGIGRSEQLTEERKKELLKELDKNILELRMPPEGLKPTDESPSKIVNPLTELINFIESNKFDKLDETNIRKMSDQLSNYEPIKLPESRSYFQNPATQSKEASKILNLTIELGKDTVLDHLKDAQKFIGKEEK